MKRFNYNAINIGSAIVGKVTKKGVHRLGPRNQYFLVQKSISKQKKYKAQIVCDMKPENFGPNESIVYGVENINVFNEGDIVQVNSEGRIDFLFENEEFFNPILVTNRCNANCIACPQPQVNKEDDRTPLNLQIISLIDKNAKTIGITGGEPTILGDNFFLLMEEIKKQLPRTNILLLSNGIKFAEFEFSRRLRKINNNNLQIDIPIHSDTDHDHDRALGVKGFYKMIQGLHNLASLNFKIGLRVVIQKLNHSRLPQIAEYIYHNFPFVYHIAFIQMEVCGVANQNRDEIWVDPYDYNNSLHKAITYLANRNMNVSIYNAQLCILPKSLWKYSKNTISSWKRIYIDVCEGCDVKDKCGGLFSTSNNDHSEHLNTVELKN